MGWRVCLSTVAESVCRYIHFEIAVRKTERLSLQVASLIRDSEIKV